MDVVFQIIQKQKRVFTEGQNLNRQLDQLIQAGVNPRNIYTEKITGTKRDCPELNRMIDYLLPNDLVIISDLIRISRSTKDLLDIVEKICQKGASIKSIKNT